LAEICFLAQQLLIFSAGVARRIGANKKVLKSLVLIHILMRITRLKLRLG
jgi:hypothetical protein